MKLELNLSKK